MQSCCRYTIGAGIEPCCRRWFGTIFSYTKLCKGNSVELPNATHIEVLRVRFACLTTCNYAEEPSSCVIHSGIVMYCRVAQRCGALPTCVTFVYYSSCNVIDLLWLVRCYRQLNRVGAPALRRLLLLIQSLRPHLDADVCRPLANIVSTNPVLMSSACGSCMARARRAIKPELNA